MQPIAGVGALFNPSMRGFVERSLDRVDYLAVIPDRGWLDRGVGAPQRFQMFPESVSLLDEASRVRPVVLHSIGLSICSAEIFDREYAQNLIELADRLNSPWMSEHLSFTRVGTGHEVNAAIPIPLPYDREGLELLIPRIRFFTGGTAAGAVHKFLLENNVYYFRYPDQDFSEEEFFNILCRSTGCGMLLDLHNLYTNAINHGFDAKGYIANLDMNNVEEIHIAGGVPMMGFHTDSHTGPVLAGVWELLEHSVPLANNLRGVTFEFHESSFGMLGESGILEQLDRAREIVSRYAGCPEVPSDVVEDISADHR